MPANPPDSTMLRDSMTREVTNDAYAISNQIFRGQEPDVARVSNQQVDERYRQAFLSNDRQYLMAEAARDPVQFLASMERLGVSMPPGEEVESKPPLPKAAKPNVPLPPQPQHAMPQTFDQPQDVPPPQALPAPAPPPSPGLVAPPSPPMAPPPGVPGSPY